MKKILIFTFALFCLVSCMNEDDASDIILFVTPSSDVTATSGDKLMFKIETWTVNGNLKSVEIRSFDSLNGSESLFSVTGLPDRYSETYIYDVPEIDVDETTVTLSFVVTDSEGNVAEKKVKVLISNDTALLKEYSSMTLYSAFSGKEDAFSLTDFKTMKSATADEKTMDIFMYAESESDNDAFNPEWRSKTGMKFVKANDMDYSKITRLALNVFYNNSNKGDNVSGISNDDIIIVGRENTAIGVFKIILVQDAAGASDDRLVFSFKPAL